MIKTIFVPVMGDAADKAKLRAAIAAARLFDAHIDGLHVRADPAEMFASAAYADIGSVLAIPELTQALAKEDEARSQRARRVFDEICQIEKIQIVEAPQERSCVSAAWHEVVGDPIEQAIWRGRFRDLVVLSTSRHHRGPDSETIGAMLMQIGRPVLLASAKGSRNLVGTVVVAWKDSPESARAVTAAMPFLMRARQIVVLAVDEHGRSVTQSLDKLAAQLRWHGLSPKSQQIEARHHSGPEALLLGVKDLHADLLVMGGYGHSRTRELVLGGFTRHILKQAELSVLLCH